jgi:cation/acetate symporter
VLLTLYWRRCNTGGIIAGMVVGTLLAVGLVLVSPNMTYPSAVRAAAERSLAADGPKRAAAQADVASGDAARAAAGQRTIAALDRAATKARDDIERVKGQTTSLVGLQAPLIQLRNPGLISIPLGFLAVIIGSLLYRDRRADEMWDELYARQNTGILASKAAAH